MSIPLIRLTDTNQHAVASPSDAARAVVLARVMALASARAGR